MENTIDFTSTENCYTSESGDSYTFAEMLDIAKGNERLARIIIGLCTWQHPETVFADLLMEEEIDEEGNILEPA